MTDTHQTPSTPGGGNISGGGDTSGGRPVLLFIAVRRSADPQTSDFDADGQLHAEGFDLFDIGQAVGRARRCLAATQEQIEQQAHCQAGRAGVRYFRDGLRFGLSAQHVTRHIKSISSQSKEPEP